MRSLRLSSTCQPWSRRARRTAWAILRAGVADDDEAQPVGAEAQAPQRDILDRRIVLAVTRMFEELERCGPVVPLAIGLRVGTVGPAIDEVVDLAELHCGRGAAQFLEQLQPQACGLARAGATAPAGIVGRRLGGQAQEQTLPLRQGHVGTQRRVGAAEDGVGRRLGPGREAEAHEQRRPPKDCAHRHPSAAPAACRGAGVSSGAMIGVEDEQGLTGAQKDIPAYAGGRWAASRRRT